MMVKVGLALTAVGNTDTLVKARLGYLIQSVDVLVEGSNPAFARNHPPSTLRYLPCQRYPCNTSANYAKFGNFMTEYITLLRKFYYHHDLIYF